MLVLTYRIFMQNLKPKFHKNLCAKQRGKKNHANVSFIKKYFTSDGPADDSSHSGSICKGGPPGGESSRKEQHRLLTLEQKRELIRMSEEERVKARDLMELFSIGKTQVYAILKQRNHIKEEYSQAKNDHEKQAKRKVRFTGNEDIDDIVHR